MGYWSREGYGLSTGRTDWFGTILTGARRGAEACGKLMLVLAPVYTLTTILKYLGVLQTVAGWCRPAMKYFGLPGDAAWALVLGNFLNLYAALGAIAALELNSGQVTLLSLMLLISHSQLLESGVFFQMRTKYQIIWAIRLVLALAVGYGLHFILAPSAGLENEAATGGQTMVTLKPELKAVVLEWLKGLFGLAWKMLAILVAIFVALEIVRRLQLLERSLRAVHRLIRFMGFSEAAGLPLLAGIVFGIVFGAGVITGAVNDQRLSRRQVLLVSIFLALCHGIIEDTGLMMLLGAKLFWITVPRIVLAIPVVWLVSRLVPESQET